MSIVPFGENRVKTPVFVSSMLILMQHPDACTAGGKAMICLPGGEALCSMKRNAYTVGWHAWWRNDCFPAGG